MRRVEDIDVDGDIHWAIAQSTAHAIDSAPDAVRFVVIARTI